jgi:6-phosphogluconolactonase
MDRLIAYLFNPDRGMFEIETCSSFKTKPGAGPRHLAFHPSGRFAYLINELDSSLIALSWKRSRRIFDEIETVTTLPSGFSGENTCADVHVSPSGRCVYASNRGHDSIIAYAIDQDTGRLKLVNTYSTQGNTPRNFTIDPSGKFLLVANQDSDNIVSFRIDQRSGALTPCESISIPTPVCIRFLPLRDF